MSQITTHVLDTNRGLPGAGVPIVLFQQQGDSWHQQAAGVTNADGRIGDLLTPNASLPGGIYRMHFDTKGYFSGLGQQSFYPYVDVVFELDDSGSHYHIPLLLSAYGYSTYRGS